MSRLLFLVAVIAVVYLLLKLYRKQLPGNGISKDNGTRDEVRGQAEDMVLCSRCGVHLPKRESIQAGGKFYCSEAHRRAHTEKSE